MSLVPDDLTLTGLPDVLTRDVGAAGSMSVGMYRLRKKVGEGGMGEVWLADQLQPLRRQVAIKLIRKGMDSHRVIARFDAERQALALMDHQAIATVFDGGTTPDGRPYFAMEYVEGEPITEYCDHRRLSIEERLQLFIQVCEGVQHAHQKGVIHRDLKPSNVLVTVREERAVPKIIDFGLAKAIAQPLTDGTVYTELGGFVGTPAYMSPEQMEGGGLDVDTRTDIYALGVILYQLLTGARPLGHDEIRGASLPELARLVRDKEPPRPSSRVRQLGVDSSAVAEHRHTESRRLAGRLRGDLDWITMKALAKDRTRRFGTAAALAADVRHHLNDEPVVAGPPSTAYLARKFIRRHRFGAGITAAAIAGLILVAIALGVQAGRIARERDRAVTAEHRSAQEAEVANRVSTFLIELFRVSDPNETKASSITAREILDTASTRIETELRNQPEIQARLMDTIGDVYANLGLYRLALPLFERSLEIRRRTLGSERVEVAQSLLHIGDIHDLMGDLAGGEPLVRQALAMRRKLLGDEHLDVTEAQNSLAVLLRKKETPEANAEAEALLRSALETRRKLLGAAHRDVAQGLVNLGMLLYANKRDFAAAEPLFREALDVYRRALGPDHNEVAITLNNLALLLRDQNRLDQSEPLFRQALTIGRKALGEAHPVVAGYAINLASVVQRRGNYRDAEDLFRQALEIDRKIFPEDHWQVATTKNLLGSCLTAAGRYPEAEPLLLDAYPVIRREWGDSHPRTAAVLRRIVALYDAWNKPAQAAKYRALTKTP